MERCHCCSVHYPRWSNLRLENAYPRRLLRLATPRIVDGKVFLGGGFGSHEFYAFDVKRRCVMIWQVLATPRRRTHRRGRGRQPCRLGHRGAANWRVLNRRGLRPAWKKWAFGDPLMSMPAAGSGRVWMGLSRQSYDRQHHLACFDLRSGLRASGLDPSSAKSSPPRFWPSRQRPPADDSRRRPSPALPPVRRRAAAVGPEAEYIGPGSVE